MSRFERQGTESGDLPALLGTATEEFRRSLEHHVQQIVDAAKQQATEIERDARRNAKEREQQLDLRSQELVKGVITRASSVLDSIELVQTAISGMLAELRAEVKALESGPSASSAAPDSTSRSQAALGPSRDQREPQAIAPEPPKRDVAKAEDRAAAPPVPQPKGAADTGKPAITPPEVPPPPETSQHAPDAPASVDEPPAPQTESEPAAQESPPGTERKPGPLIDVAADQKAAGDRRDSSAEFDQMIHGEIRRMYHGGKSRAEVEGFLARFELGDTYTGLLDELYSQKDPAGRRRIFGRRRDR